MRSRGLQVGHYTTMAVGSNPRAHRKPINFCLCCKLFWINVREKYREHLVVFRPHAIKTVVLLPNTQRMQDYPCSLKYIWNLVFFLMIGLLKRSHPSEFRKEEHRGTMAACRNSFYARTWRHHPAHTGTCVSDALCMRRTVV